MSEGLCTSCGAAVNLAAGLDEINCTYCGTLVKRPEAEAQFAEVKNSKFGGMLLIAETAQEGGNYEEALNYYNKVIEQEPTFADAWLNKGTCMVKSSTIQNLKVTEAISSWKAAVKFAKNSEAMKKRVALVINNTVANFYPVLEKHYLEFSDLNYTLSAHGQRFLLLESAQSYAMELNPCEQIAKNGVDICDFFIASIKSAAAKDANAASTSLFLEKDWKGALTSGLKAGSKEKLANDLAKTLQVTKGKYEQALAKVDPLFANEIQELDALGVSKEQADLIYAGKTDLVITRVMKEKGSFKSRRLAMKAVDEAEKKLRSKYPERFSSKKGGCFVATACYGNYDHPVVMELRHFRDDCLETSTAGRAFVRWYYQWSPAFASLVAKSKTLKTLARVLIVTPVVAVARMVSQSSCKK